MTKRTYNKQWYRDRYQREKDKIKAKVKRYYQANSKKIIEYQEEYRSKNRQKINARQKEYYLNNKDKITTYKSSTRYKKLRQLSRKQRRRIDQSYRILDNCRRRIHAAIVKGYKSKKTQQLLGCSIEFLKTYLEQKFQNGMTWDNYGKWHIDHIRPCSSFNLLIPEEQLLCFNWKNLQPLWASENIKKANKFL
jgi:hypothetical protein